MGKIAYQTDEHGYYIGQVPCQESPLEPGIFLIPRGATEIAPPKNFGPDKIQKFDFVSKQWAVVEHPAVTAKKIELEEEKKRLEEIENKTAFELLSAEERRIFIEQMRESKLKLEVETAFTLFTWHDWSGKPLEAEWKKEWAEYRKALLALPLGDFDFSTLNSPEDFPWPQCPVLPPDLY